MYNVLFVEDDNAIAYIVSTYKAWKSLGFRIGDIADNGRMALEKINHNSYDLIITDIRMPVMDGLELIRRVKRMPNPPEVVLASTYSEFEYAKEGIRLGVLDYIEKPYSEIKIETVLKAAKNIFESSSIKLDGGFTSIQQQVKEFCDWGLMNRLSSEELCYAIDEITKGKDINLDQAYAYIIKRMLITLWERHPWIKQMENFGKVSDMMDRALLIEFTDNISRIVEYYRLDCKDDTINECCGYLAEHIKENNIIDGLASQLGMSKDYLNRLFKNKMGMTIHKYFQMMKVLRAKNLLKDTKLKIYEISEDLGYSTVDYFTKLFKEYTGQTPSQFKQNTSVK